MIIPHEKILVEEHSKKVTGKTPTVTVLMAVYNGMPFLPQALKSILRQTLEDFELLIVDDASTDGTQACLTSTRDARIRLIRNATRLGQTGSLNRGLRMARGVYVARMDADDLAFPDRLEKQVRFIDRHPEIAVLATRLVGIDSRGSRAYLLGKPLTEYGDFVGQLLTRRCPVYHSSSMFRRDQVEQWGGYDEQFRIGQDYELWIRFAMNRCQAYVFPEPLAMYRIHARQQSVAQRQLHQEELNRAHEQMVRAFCSDGQAHRVALALRADGQFWSCCASAREVADTAQALEELLTKVRERLKLSPAQVRILRSSVYGWVGWGLRLAPRMKGWPWFVFYPAVGFSCPLLLPQVHPLLSRLSALWRRVLLAAGWIFRRQEGWTA